MDTFDHLKTMFVHIQNYLFLSSNIKLSDQYKYKISFQCPAK